MIFYIIYESTPTTEVTLDVLDEITQECIKGNGANGITGMLLGTQSSYIQILEGEEYKVRPLFDKIKKDPRHTNISIRIQGFTKERIFKEWSMGSWLLSNAKLKEITALKDLSKFLGDDLNSELQTSKYISMMKNLLNTWIAHEPERSKKFKN